MLQLGFRFDVDAVILNGTAHRVAWQAAAIGAPAGRDADRC